jgi:D-glycero-alpha-D-manno-heptose 1-phosphate guanylyltransferase
VTREALNKQLVPKEVIILAGGMGTRLKNVLNGEPKCLARINGKPFLSILINQLLSFNVVRFIFSLGYGSESVKKYILENHNDIEYVFCTEPEPLGTGGAIRLALEFSKHRYVFIVNGDSYFDIDIEEIFNFAKRNESPFTIALNRVSSNIRYGNVEINESNKIISFHEKKESKNVLINSGYYILDKNKINFSDYNYKFSLESDFFESKFRGIEINGIEFKSKFIDIGIPEDYKKAQKFFNI